MYFGQTSAIQEEINENQTSQRNAFFASESASAHNRCDSQTTSMQSIVSLVSALHQFGFLTVVCYYVCVSVKFDVWNSMIYTMPI